MEGAAAEGICTLEHPVVCKPMPEAYELVLRSLGVHASEVLFADDSVRNITAAHKLGMLTVLVSSTVCTGYKGRLMLDLLHYTQRSCLAINGPSDISVCPVPILSAL